jgi:ABC-2 type transport system permease protein
MNILWQVITFEYARHVFRKRFLLGLFSLPVFIGIMAIVVLLLVRSEINLKPIGYVDHSGLLPGPDSLVEGGSLASWVELIPYHNEESAQSALESDQIQAFFLLGENYLETRQAKLVALDEPSSIATGQFAQFVRTHLLENYPPEIAQRLMNGNQLIVRSIDGSRQFIQGDWLGFLLPFLVAFVFLVAVFATSGYLLQAVVEEKENRTMELLVTTISPNRLMAGKVMGIIAVGWTQLFVWFGLVVLLVLFGSIFVNLPDWISISIGYLGLAIVLFVPAFIMLSALMVAVGATLADVQEAQQVTSLLTLPLFIPFWFALTLINDPYGNLAVALSFIPFTAPITIAIRAGFAVIPAWQIGISLGLLIVFAVLAIWFAGRAFRIGMLRYGQRVAWWEFLGQKKKGESV